MANVNSITDGFFIGAQEGFITTTSGPVTSGATTVGLNSVAGYANGDWVTFVIDPTTPASKQVFHGQIDAGGSQVINVTWTEGSNTPHLAGATVADYETATAWQLQRKGLLVSHNQDGTLKAKGRAYLSFVNTTAQTFSGSSKVKIIGNSGTDETTITTSGGDLFCTGGIYGSLASGTIYLDAQVGSHPFRIMQSNIQTQSSRLGTGILSGVPAGTHTVTMRAFTSSAGAVFTASTYTTFTLSVIEL